MTHITYGLYTVYVSPVAGSPLTPLSLTEVRERISQVFSDAVHGHRPVPIIRGNRDLGMLLGLEEVGRLVEGVSFHPEVLKEDDAVSVWLPEFQVYGRGSDLSAARNDLLEEVREYIFEYLDEIDLYRSAPNRQAHFAHVVKALVADLSGKLQPVIFDDRSQGGARDSIAAADLR